MGEPNKASETEPPEYPESEKLRGKQEQAFTLSEFLDWCEGKGVVLCKTHDADYFYTPVSAGNEAIIYAFLGVNLERLNAEREAMLSEKRKDDAARQDPFC